MEDKTKRRIREIKQRAWKERKKKIRIFFIVSLLIILICGVYEIKKAVVNFLWNIDTFKLKKIEVIPEKAITYINPVIEIEKGKNLLFLDIKKLREMILKIPGVENCKIKKIYPDKLQIEVMIRKPFVCIIAENKKYIVDKKGVVVKNVSDNNYIIVKGIKINSTCVDETDKWKLKVLENIEKWYNFYNLRKFISIEEVEFISPNEIILITEKGKIKIRKADIKLQMEKLFNLLNQKIGKWEYIDLRFKNIYKK